MDEPTLTTGDTGEWVTYLQQLLQQHGYLSGEPDGDFGPGTFAAVQAYQAALGLDADGSVGPQPWAALTGETTGGTTDGTSDVTTGGTTDESWASGGEGAVPVALQEAGAPADLAQWSDEQREAFFEGTVSSGVIAETEPEDVPVLAMAGTGEGDQGGQLA